MDSFEQTAVIPGSGLDKDFDARRLAFLEPSLLCVDMCSDPGIKVYIGSYIHSLSKAVLKKLGVTAMLCVKDGVRFRPGYVIKHIPLSDFGESDIIGSESSDSRSLDPALYRCAEFMRQCALDGHSVLIHCSSGVNRAPTVVIGLLMLIKQWNLRQSYFCVLRSRPGTSPHQKYITQLQLLDKRLHGMVSLLAADVSPSLKQRVQAALAEELKSVTSSPSCSLVLVSKVHLQKQSNPLPIASSAPPSSWLTASAALTMGFPDGINSLGSVAPRATSAVSCR